jgi:hypothetical protein
LVATLASVVVAVSVASDRDYGLSDRTAESPSSSTRVNPPIDATTSSATTDLATGGQDDAAFWDGYSASLETADEADVYPGLQASIEASDGVVVGTFQSVEIGRSAGGSPGVPPLVFANLTVRIDSVITGGAFREGESIIVELPIIPIETEEVREAQAEAVRNKALLENATTDDDVAAAVDLEALEKRIAELYPTMIDAGFARMSQGLPQSKYLILLRRLDGVPGADGHFRPLNFGAIISEGADGSAVSVVSTHSAVTLQEDLSGVSFADLQAALEG